MALTLDLDPKPKPQWVSDRRICLTANGVVCDEADPAAASLLVCEGGSLDLEVAVQYGLANADGSTIPPAAEKKPKAPAPKPAAPKLPLKTAETKPPEA